MKKSVRLVALLAAYLLLFAVTLPAAADVIPDPANPTAQFSITKSASATEVRPGDTFTYSIDISCSAISDVGCRSAITTDAVPAPLQIQNVTTSGPNSANTPAVSGQDVKVTWTQDLDAGAGQAIGMLDNTTSHVEITVKVPDDISYDENGTTLTNTAVAEATNAADKQASASVNVVVPLALDTTASKSFQPDSALAAAGTPVTASLGGSNDSNATVDTLVIQDPVNPDATPNPFDSLGFTGFGEVTAPEGATGTTYEVYVDGAWVTAPGGNLPPGVDPADVQGTRVTFTGAIPPDAKASVDLDLQTTEQAAGVTQDTTVTNNVSSRVALDDQSASDNASADFTIRANAVQVSASKSFSPDLVVAGGSSTVTIGGTNASSFPIDTLTLTEPANGSFPDDYTFGGFTGGIAYPAGATSGTVTFQFSDGTSADVDFADGATPAVPAGHTAVDVTSFSVRFTGDIAAGAETSVPFDVDTDADATGLPTTSTNQVQVEGENNGVTDDATASDDLYIYGETIQPYIDKQVRPSRIVANPGEVVTVSLQGGTTERPNPPQTPDGTTGNADQIVIQDPLAPVAGNPWWNAFDLDSITQTPIPADASLTVYYYDTTDDTWKVLDGPVAGPNPSYNYDVPDDISDVAGGVRFVYDYTGDGDGFAPGTDLAPNFTSSLRDQGRYDGAAPPYNTDPNNPDTTIPNCAQSSASSATPGVPDGNARMAPADCPVIDIVPANGQGVGDLISKTFGTSSSGGVKTVIARSGDTIPSTLAWSTGGYSNLSTVDLTDVADPEGTDVADSVYDAFDLTHLDAITAGADPHLKYDQVTEVELWNGNAWVDAANDPCPQACDGTFPGMDLTGAEQASTLGVRLVYAESPTRAQTSAGDLDAPPVGSGVARSFGNDRHLTLVWRIRDTKRSDGTPALADVTYNLDDPGVVRNTANATGHPADGSAPISDSAQDDVVITDVPITTTTTKSWSGGPLALPTAGTPADQYPLSQVSVTTTNTTPAKVDQLQITDPSPGSVGSPQAGPFDYFRLNSFAAITQPAGTQSTTVTLTCPDASIRTLTRDAALALTPGTMPCDVTKVQVLFGGRIASAAAGVLTMDLRLRPTARDSGDPITTDDSPVVNAAQGVVADVDAIGTCPPAPGARYACATGSDTIDLTAPTFGIDAGKTITPASQSEGDDSPVTVTVSAQNSGSARPYLDQITDDDPTFWNAMDFVAMDPSWTLPQPVKYVRACYLSGGTFTAPNVAGDSVGGTWTCQQIPGGGPPFADGDLTLAQARGFINDAAAAGTDIHGLRFEFMAGDEVGWQNPANPLIQVPFQVQRRDVLRTGGTVPTTRSDQTPAPGEQTAGVFVDTVEVEGESVLVGAGTRLTGDDTADDYYTYAHKTVGVTVDKTPDGQVQPGQVIPYTLSYTNTGQAPLTDPVFTDTLPSDAHGPQLIFDPDSDPDITSPYGFVLTGDAPDPPSGDPLPTDQDDITITQAGGTITFAMPQGTVLEVGQTYTITVDLMLRPGLTPEDQVTNTAGVTAGEPFDPGACAPSYDVASGACTDQATVSPVRVAALSTVKKVKADVPVDEPGVPEIYLDRALLPAGSDVPDDYCDTAADDDGFYRSPCVPVTYPGDTETWRYTITNNGTLPMDELVSIDELPARGDTGVLVDLPRGSEWDPTYVNSLRLIDPGDHGATLSVWYTPSPAPCTDDLDPLGAKCPANSWRVYDAANPPAASQVGSLKAEVDFPAGELFQPGEKLSLQFQTRTTPTDASDSSYPVAWNTVATGGVSEDQGIRGTVLPSEGRKVGVTYPTGPIQLQKTVTGDGAQYAPDSFQVQLHCTAPGSSTELTGLPEVTLIPGDEPTQVDGLPWGADCTATEADQGQTSQTIGTATVGGPDDDVGLISIENRFDVGDMTITKRLDSDAVDQDGTPIAYGPFRLGVDCRFLGNPVFADGYSLINPMTETLDAGQTWTLTDLPIGATCTTTEPGDADAATTTISPSPVTIGGADADPQDVEAVTVTNHYDVGSLQLRKYVPTAAQGFPISQGPFTLHVACTLTDASHPDGESVYDDDVVLQGAQPLTARIDDLATGAVCTVTEPDPGAATSHVITPKTVTIGADTTVRVVATNLFGAGRLTITKNIDGPGADLYGAGPFEVNVSCSYTDVGGHQVPLATPGGATRELSAADDYTVTYAPLLVGSTCHVEETRTGGATDTAITDAAGNQVSDVTIDSLTQQLQIDITNTFDVGQVEVRKVVHGDGSGPYTVLLQCRHDVDGTPTDVDIPGGAQRNLTENNNLRTVYQGLPTGATCHLKETDTGGADSTTITPNNGDPTIGTVTVGDGTTVSLQVVNTFDSQNASSPTSSDTGGLADTGASPWTTYAALGGVMLLLLGVGLIARSRRRSSR